MSNSEYQKLKKKWYAKLEKSGFHDIEQDDGYGNLKDWSHRFARVDALHERQEYYIMASRFLNDYKFKNKRDYVIWLYHSEGLSYRDTAAVMQKARFKIPEWEVRVRVNALIAAMFEFYKVAVR